MDKYTGFDIDSKKIVGVPLAGVWPDFLAIDLLLGNTYSQEILSRPDLFFDLYGSYPLLP